ncbi:alpha/beta fold hydrolase [Rhodobacteraceae bacterium B1Z28]|uniref:Alpha/beta fold hydrolase n=1 Tax=Ruegeria haliotis TaxID=2747601 RepID=A0ABX2PXH0_9RHOB|nr:alpha/beta fold hydrolase [Ruegeria haliotis]NVO58514.1 alpha/beta fold hydrolase [Ruegeria haliotis]
MKYAPPFQRTNGLLPVLVVFAALILLPLVITETYARHTLILVFIYAVLASNWDLSLGYGGIVNFAHLGFFAIGLYAYAILAKVIGLDPWVSLLITPLFAVTFAVLLAIPILRLEGIYVILVTIAATQLLQQIVVSQSSYTGGTSGMVLLPRLEIAGYKLSSDNRLGYYYFGLALLTASTFFLYKLERSSIGRAIKALRDNKYYAISRGVSEARTRLVTLSLSAIFPALAGGFYGAYLRVASPDVFGLGFLTIALSVLLLGGVATIWGSLIAAFVVVGLSQLLVDYGAWRNIAIALVIISVVVVYPGGLYAAMQEIWSGFDRAKTNLIATFRRKSGAPARARAMGTTDQLVETSHGAVSVCDTHSGAQTIIFIHGNSSCKEVFRHQLEALRDQFRCVAFDLPGHGVSPNADPDKDYNLAAYAQIVAELVERLKLGRPIIFGWSLGGYVALEYVAAGNPITALAICGTSPVRTYPDDMPKGYIPSPHMELAGKRFHSPHEKGQYATHTIGLQKDAEPILWQAVWRTDGHAREQAFAKLKTTDWQRQISVIQSKDVPFVMINGPNDPFINHTYCARSEFGTPFSAHPILIEGAGHAPFLEDPKPFTQEFLRFIRAAQSLPVE